MKLLQNKMCTLKHRKHRNGKYWKDHRIQEKVWEIWNWSPRKKREVKWEKAVFKANDREFSKAAYYIHQATDLRITTNSESHKFKDNHPYYITTKQLKSKEKEKYLRNLQKNKSNVKRAIIYYQLILLSKINSHKKLMKR